MKRTTTFVLYYFLLTSFVRSHTAEFNSGNLIEIIKHAPTELLVGTWEGIIEGDKLIWTVSPNGTEEYNWYHSTGIQHGAGKWTVEEDILYEQFEQSKTVCKIKFVTVDHVLLTVLDNGNPNNRGQKRDYYRKVPKSGNVLKEENATMGTTENRNNQDRQPVTEKTGNKIIGTWKSRICVANEYTIFVYKFFENGQYSVSAYGHMSKYEEKGTYSLHGNLLSTKNAEFKKSNYNISWLDGNMCTLSLADSKTKYFFKRASSINSDDEIKLSAVYDDDGRGLTDNTSGGTRSDEGTTRVMCVACDGTGLIKSSSYNVKTDCLTSEEIHRAFMTDNPDVKITCCHCKGTGWVYVH